MKIISNKKWEQMDDLVVKLQLDLNDMREQKELAEAQVEYLLNEIDFLKNKGKKKVEVKKSGKKGKNVQKK